MISLRSPAVTPILGVCLLAIAILTGSVEGGNFLYSRTQMIEPPVGTNHGSRVDIDGDTMVVISAGGTGHAHVYARIGHQWVFQTTLSPSDSPVTFGASVAISGDTIVVGDSGQDLGAGADQGAAYIFERDLGGADNWGERTRIDDSTGAAGDDFGQSVAISGDTIAIGAIGNAYIFERDLGGADMWGERTQLTSSDGNTGLFGHAIDLDGDTVVVGAFVAPSLGMNSAGAAYVFERDLGGPNSWDQRMKLEDPTPGNLGLFAYSLAIHGDRIAVGNYLHKGICIITQGSVVMFERDTGGLDNWGLTVEILSRCPQTGSNIDLGFSVAVSGGLVVATSQEPGHSPCRAFSTNGAPLGELIGTKQSSISRGDCALSGQDLVVGYRGAPNGSGPGYVEVYSVILLEHDCDSSGVGDPYEIRTEQVADCNDNFIPDLCDITADPSLDLNMNDIIDACELCQGDADGTGVVNFADITEVLIHWLEICP